MDDTGGDVMDLDEAVDILRDELDAVGPDAVVAAQVPGEAIAVVLAELDRLRRESLAEVPGAVGAIGNTVLFAELDRLTAQRDAVLALHRDAGPGMGHDTPSGDYYGDFPTSCTTCGTSDEYAVAWPCPTARALGVES